MEILRFTLCGSHAFFKKPEVNAYVYFTYGNIHKAALLGIFGAILGYGGHAQMAGFLKKRNTSLEESVPQFYERLKDIQLCILPDSQNETGFIPKKIQTFNNSVGYASGENGGTLIVKEQWLEYPQWEICVLVDSEEAERLKAAIINRRCVYYPYLGKNDHLASIKNIQLETAEECEFSVGRLDCLLPADSVSFVKLDDEAGEEMDFCASFQYREALPYKMNPLTNLYELRTFLYTDDMLEVKGGRVYKLSDGKKILFY